MHGTISDQFNAPSAAPASFHVGAPTYDVRCAEFHSGPGQSASTMPLDACRMVPTQGIAVQGALVQGPADPECNDSKGPALDAAAKGEAAAGQTTLVLAPARKRKRNGVASDASLYLPSSSKRDPLSAAQGGTSTPS